ncbi:hypothetical protein AnigIFM50267_006784 [Aspergillus niger]|nr:hypothetical protein AnigIFM50267_006784 [Aspergillus niger]
MKRKNDAVPEAMVQRWSRPPLSCRFCRAKKLRCDRTQPCANCVLRKVPCEYTGQGPSDTSDELRGAHLSGNQPTAATVSTQQPAPTIPSTYSQTTIALHPNDISSRVTRLEEAVFDRIHVPRDPPSIATATQGSNNTNQSLITRGAQGSSNGCVTPLTLLPLASAQRRIADLHDYMRDTNSLSRCLPPWTQARQLLDHFNVVIQSTFGVFHIPSTRDLLEETYRGILEGEEPSPTVLVLFFSIFAGAVLVATPELLQLLSATQAEAKAAFTTYVRLAICILDNPIQSVPPSTIALEAINALARVLLHADWYSHKAQALRVDAICMARSMQIHRLDTVQRREERKRSGYNAIEVEVQRRAWWHLVSSDWISAFSQSPQEGTYLIHPKQMKVNHPSNIDDEFLTPTGPEHSFPLSVPTSMSVFIFRIHYAELCREIIDTLGTTLLESDQPDYETLLEIDGKFHTFIQSLPLFLRNDPASIQKSQDITQQRPYLAWQRTVAHLSLHVRLCRLHRPYHREGLTNPKFAYSRLTCIRSAQTVLDLRHSLEDTGVLSGFNPSDYSLVMNHVFFAAMVLATDVSMNPTAPGADTRKQEVLDVIHVLEKSQNVSTSLMEAIRKNTQTLLSILQDAQRELQQQGRSPKGNDIGSVPSGSGGTKSSAAPSQPRSVGVDENMTNVASGHLPFTGSMHGSSQEDDDPMWSGARRNSWGQLWSDLFNVAPEMDGLQWDLLLNDSDLPLQSNFY